jgi:hypothetical protein
VTLCPSLPTPSPSHPYVTPSTPHTMLPDPVPFAHLETGGRVWRAGEGHRVQKETVRAVTNTHLLEFPRGRFFVRTPLALCPLQGGRSPTPCPRTNPSQTHLFCKLKISLCVDSVKKRRFVFLDTASVVCKPRIHVSQPAKTHGNLQRPSTGVCFCFLAVWLKLVSLLRHVNCAACATLLHYWAACK